MVLELFCLLKSGLCSAILFRGRIRDPLHNERLTWVAEATSVQGIVVCLSGFTPPVEIGQGLSDKEVKLAVIRQLRAFSKVWQRPLWFA